MKTRSSHPRVIVLHVVEVVYALGLLAWLALPLWGVQVGVFTAWDLPTDLAPVAEGALPFSPLVAALVAITPLLALWKILAPPFSRLLPALCRSTHLLPAILNVLLTADVLALMVLHVLRYAAGWAYFRAVPAPQYVVAGVTAAWNAGSLILLMAIVNRRDPAYREYIDFRRGTERVEHGAGVAMARQGIQRRLGLTYIPLIAILIAGLSWVLLRDYRATVLASIIDAGRALADRTASTAKANADDLIAVDDYLSFEAQKNAEARLRFSAVSLVWRASSRDAWQVGASTDRRRIGTPVPAGLEPPAAPSYRYVEERQVWEFLSPVSLAGRALGWVTVEYERSVIDEPLFRTGVKVVLLAALSVYASAFLTYLFGRAIVFPILFLRMGVSGIATALGSMIRGKSRVSAELLQYKAHVRTRDEIKSLSDEIGNMATVLRGIVPYISQSTLKQAERAKPTTEQRDLVLLFTDIRGFTKFCEKNAAQPAVVVDLLNRYLQIQSTIVHESGGDIDKFVGDAMFARFEGPKKELNACRAAMAIRTAMAEEQERASTAGQDFFPIGIGIASGRVVLGSVGAKDRMDFTAIGDDVNLASRLESANKIYGTKTLLTDAVRRSAASAYLCREIDLMTVVGKRKPVRIYELLQEKQKAEAKLLEMVGLFEGGLAAYRKQQWQIAERAFGVLARKYRDKTSAVFLRRIALFRKSPPPKDWIGVFDLTVK